MEQRLIKKDIEPSPVLCLTIDKIIKDADYRVEKNIVTISEKTPNIIVEKTKAPQGKLVIKFNKLYALIRDDGTLVPKKGKKINYHGLGESFAKNLFNHLNEPEKIILLGTGRYNVIVSMKNADGDNVLISLEIGGRKQIRGDHGKVNEVITAFGCDDNYVDDLVNNPKNKVVYEKKDDTSQGRQRASYVSLTVNDVSSDIIITNPPKNVNHDSERRQGTVLCLVREAYIICEADIIPVGYITRSGRNGYH